MNYIKLSLQIQRETFHATERRKTARMFLFVIRTPEWQSQCYQTEALMPISSHSLLPFQPLSFRLCKNTPDFCELFTNEFQLILPSSTDYLHRLLQDYGSCFHHVQMFTLLSLFILINYNY